MTEGKGKRQMKIMTSTAIALAVLALGAAGLRAESEIVTPGAQQKSEATEVRIDNFSFGPAELTVPVGTTVTWTNHDDIPHTVVSVDKVFKSKVMDTDETFSFT